MRIFLIAVLLTLPQIASADELSRGDVFLVAPGEQLVVTFSAKNFGRLNAAKTDEEMRLLVSSKFADIIAESALLTVLSIDGPAVECRVQLPGRRNTATAYVPAKIFSQRKLTRKTPTFHAAIGRFATGWTFDAADSAQRGEQLYFRGQVACTVHGDASIGSKGVAGESLLLGGDKSFVNAENLLVGWRRAPRKELTIAFWVRIADLKRTSFLFDLRDLKFKNPSIMRIYYSDTGELGFKTPGGEFRSKVELGSEWRHLAFTWKEKVRRIYVDGELESEHVGDFRPLHPREIAQVRCRLGSQTSGSRGPKPKQQRRCLKGSLDEFVVFTQQLSSVDVQQLWRKGIGGNSSLRR